MLTDRNKTSAYFPGALTLADLNNNPQSVSEESDMDLSQSKLNRLGLGIDISSLHAPESSGQQDMSDVKNGLNDFNKSIQQYTKKFNDSTGDLSHHMEQFKQKMHDIQMDLVSDGPTSDPYKISIHSLRGQSTQPIPDHTNSQTQKFQTSGPTSRFPQPNASFSSGGLSYQPPHLHSTNNGIRADPTGNMREQLEYHKLKYYDSFLPSNHQILNNPLKYFKYKVQSQNKYQLEHCLDTLIN